MSIDFNSLSPEELEALLNGPALTPPSGITPNFDNPPNRSAMANGVYGFFFALGSLFVFARAYGLWRSSKRMHISDYLMVVSYGLYTGFMAVILRQVHVGYFVHQWDFRLRDVSKLFYLFHLATNIWAATIMLIKATILLEWLHIFVPIGTRNYFWWISVFLIGLDLLFYSAAIIAINLTCNPHAKIYDPLVAGTCLDSRAIDISSSVINFFIDLAILILPQKVIWGLRMSFKKRLGVSAVFIVGIVACFAAGFRLAVTVSYSKSDDLTYSFCNVGIWVVVETTCGLIVLCTPAIPLALNELGIQNLVSITKSWTRFSSTKRSTAKMSNQDSKLSNPYNEISRTYPVTSHSMDSQKPFGAHYINAYPNQNDAPFTNNPSDTAILRTTQVGVTTEDRHPDSIEMSQQHPWNQRVE